MKRIGKFLKSNIKLVIGLVIGAVVSGAGVYATSTNILYAGEQIGFDNTKAGLTLNGESVTNIQEALDALYEKAKNASGCPKGYTKVIETSIRYLCELRFSGTATDLANSASLYGLENAADAYRYVGANPDNYVWFNNEQWRIIGIYGDNLKIVKATPSTTSQVYRNSTSSDAWNGSTMQATYLYNTYWSTLSSDAIAMIETEASWNVGAASATNTASQAYTNAVKTKWTGKIGLIASYEYQYAATSDCWTKPGNSSSGASYDYRACKDKDWLWSSLTNSGSNAAWTSSPSGYSGSYGLALDVNTLGSVSSGYVNNIDAASPVVYLKSTISITGGNGKSGEENSYKLGL